MVVSPGWSHAKSLLKIVIDAIQLIEEVLRRNLASVGTLGESVQGFDEIRRNFSMEQAA